MVQGVLRMNMMLKTAGVAVLGAGLFLSACVPTETQVPASAPAKATVKLPPDVLEYGLNAVVAGMTVDNCPKEFRVNKDYENAVVAAFEAKYGKRPAWAGADARKMIPQRELQDRFIDYIQRRDIVMADRSTWCAAGKAEVAGKTAIGKHLIAR